MKKLISLVTFVVLSISINSCALFAKEVARLPINKVSMDNKQALSKETQLTLVKGEKVAIWSEMNMEYEGDVLLLFKIEILKDGKEFKSIEFDPRDKNVSIKEVLIHKNGKTKWRFQGKNAKILIEEDGIYTFKGILVASENSSLILHKAELIFKT